MGFKILPAVRKKLKEEIRKMSSLLSDEGSGSDSGFRVH